VALSIHLDSAHPEKTLPERDASTGSETMIHKKADGKKRIRSRLSLVSRLLDGALRAALPVPPPEEPWRNKKLNGKFGFKR
jgi:hypothetical protein